MRQTRVASLLLAASLFSLLCTSCVLVNYSFTPPDTTTNASLIANNSTISFDLHHDLSTEGRSAFRDAFKEVQDIAAFHETDWPDDIKIPNTGPHVSVRLDYHETKIFPSWNSFYIFLNVWTMKIIPYYGERRGMGPASWHYTSGIVVMYELYVDGAQKKAYTYPITKKEFSWILASLALPFRPSDGGIRNALTATTRQFLRDAQRDGFLSMRFLDWHLKQEAEFRISFFWSVKNWS